MSACMNDWPTHDMLSVDYTTHHSVIAQYQQNEGTPQDMWLPVRRSSIYGPLLYYSSVNYGIFFFLVYTWMVNRYYSFFQVQKESACRARSNASQILQRMRMNVCYWRRIQKVKWYFVPLERYQRSAFIGLDVVLKPWHPTHWHPTCAHHLGSVT